MSNQKKVTIWDDYNNAENEKYDYSSDIGNIIPMMYFMNKAHSHNIEMLNKVSQKDPARSNSYKAIIKITEERIQKNKELMNMILNNVYLNMSNPHYLMDNSETKKPFIYYKGKTNTHESNYLN